jgi:hypothetical protein
MKAEKWAWCEEIVQELELELDSHSLEPDLGLQCVFQFQQDVLDLLCISILLTLSCVLLSYQAEDEACNDIHFLGFMIPMNCFKIGLLSFLKLYRFFD